MQPEEKTVKPIYSNTTTQTQPLDTPIVSEHTPEARDTVQSAPTPISDVDSPKVRQIARLFDVDPTQYSSIAPDIVEIINMSQVLKGAMELVPFLQKLEKFYPARQATPVYRHIKNILIEKMLELELKEKLKSQQEKISGMQTTQQAH